MRTSLHKTGRMNVIQLHEGLAFNWREATAREGDETEPAFGSLRSVKWS